MQSAPLPIIDQLLIVLLGPPIMAALWWLASRRFGMNVQGGSVSDRTKRRQKKEFWILLVLLYGLGIAIVLYAHLRPS